MCCSNYMPGGKKIVRVPKQIRPCLQLGRDQGLNTPPSTHLRDPQNWGFIYAVGWRIIPGMQHSHLARSFAAAYCWAAFLTVVAIVVCGIPARAWGPEGHRMIAIITAQHLSSSAQDGVRTLL